MELRDYWHVLWKRKWVVIIVTFVAFISGIIINYKILPVVFSATAQILVEQPPRILMLTEKTSGVAPRLSVETHVKLIKSLRVARAAAETLGMTEKQGAALRNAIQVRNVEDTGIIHVTFESSNPKTCADVANAFATAFEEISQKISRETLEEAMLFIEEQLAVAERDLKDAERKIFEYNAKYGVVSLDEEALQLNNTITRFEIDRMTAQIKLHGLQAQLASYENILNDKTYSIYTDPDAIMNETWIADIRMNIVNMASDRAALMMKYKPDHPRVKAIDKKIKQLESELEKSLSALVSQKVVFVKEMMNDRSKIVQLNTEVLLTRGQLDKYDKLVANLKARQSNYPELKYEYSSLTRERDIAEELYLMLYEKRQQAHIDEVQRDVKVRVFDEAVVPIRPVKPERRKNMIIIVVLGLILGICAAYAFEELEETIRTSDDVKTYLNLPVLGSIPYSAETINKLITEVPLKSPIAESYRRLSFFTQLFCLDPPIKTLLITSSKSDEGKSTTLANLAISIAQEGTKVLIVDTDLRRPMLHRMFNVDNSLGLSSILSGELEAELAVSDLSTSGHLPRDSFMEVVVDRMIQPLSIKGLSIIPSGPLPANSIELLRSERMLEFLRTVEKKADIVLFDSPPSIHVIDAVVLSQILDGVMFVINAGRVNKDEALQVKYMIESTKTPIIGIALNNIEVTSPDYYYYYYYGGYGYGSRQRRKRVKLKR